MKMMMISSLVETVGWGTPSMPGGGNKAIGVLGEAIKVEGDPVATITAGPRERQSGKQALFSSHHILSDLKITKSDWTYVQHIRLLGCVSIFPHCISTFCKSETVGACCSRNE